MLQVDPGREFFGEVTKTMEKHQTLILSDEGVLKFTMIKQSLKDGKEHSLNACLGISMLWKL